MRRTRPWRLCAATLALVATALVPAVVPAAAAPMPPAAPVTEFSDVPVGAPFRAEIAWLASTGITTGWPDGTFHPSAPVERQAMAAFLYRFAGSPPFTPPATATFSDVPRSHPFFEEIEWLASSGVTRGYPDGTFHPSASVERQAMAAFLYRYAGSPAFAVPGTASFPDVPIGAPFLAEIEWLASTGVTTGYPDGTFHPGAKVERQAMAAFLFRYATTVEDRIAPSPVGFVAVSGVSETSVTLSWTAPADDDVAGIVVRRTEGAEAPASAWDGALVADLGPDATEVTDAELVAGTVYTYGVFTRDEAGNFSDAATTNAATTPVPVEEVSYTLAPGALQAAAGEVTDVSTAVGDVPVDGSGVPTGEPAPWQATVVLAAGAQVPAFDTDFVVPPGDPTYPEGMAGVVVGVIRNADGTTTLQLAPAALDEVFSDLHVTYSGPLGDGTWDPAAEATPASADGPEVVPAAPSLSAVTIAAATGAQPPSARALQEAATGAPLDCKDEQGRTVSDTVKLAVEVRFENVGWHFAADLGSAWADPYVAMWVSAEPVASVTGSASTAMTCTIAPAWTTAHTKVFPIPGMPVGTTLSLGPYVEFEVNAEAAIEMSQRMYSMGGFITNPDGSLRELRASSADPLDLNVSGELEVSVAAGMVIQLGYLDRAGLYGKAGLELAGSVSASAGSDNELCASAHLDAAGSLGVFLDVWVARWEYQAVELSVRLWGTETCFEALPPDGGTDPVGGSITLISRASDGTPADSDSHPGQLSTDGRWVTYSSYASTLVPGDTYGTWDVFVTDRSTGLTTRVSSGPEAPAVEPSVSADGRWVTYGNNNVYLVDRSAGTTTVVPKAPDGSPANGPSNGPAISADGRWVTFASEASNLVAGDVNGQPDVFVADTTTGAITLISAAGDGSPGNGNSNWPSISADGRWISYSSWATNLAAGDANGIGDVFVTNRETGETTRVSAPFGGLPANGQSFEQTISGDGRWIAYLSFATNLAPGAAPGSQHVYLTDRTTGFTTLVSVAPDGAAADGNSIWPSISDDGRWLVYTSYGSNLVPGDVNNAPDVFVTDTTSGITRLVSVGLDGSAANSGSYNPFISADGRWISFKSDASNLVADDTNAVTDVFVAPNPGL